MLFFNLLSRGVAETHLHQCKDSSNLKSSNQVKCVSNLNVRTKRCYSLTYSSWHVCVDVASRTIRLNTSLFWASLPASVGLICSHSLMSSVHLLVGRPFLLLPSSLASNMLQVAKKDRLYLTYF